MAYRLVNGKFVNTNDPQFQMYNALGRDAGQQTNSDDNFFAKRGASLENAFGTTGSAVVSKINDNIQQGKTTQMLEDNQAKLDNIAKKYGYGSYKDAMSAVEAADTAGDTAKMAEFENGMLGELKAQSAANVETANKNASDYADYAKNSYVGQKINQDRGKFLGSAINTLSTGADVLLPGAGVAFNAVQGGVEGVADELEQNGLQNFDWGRAGQNAAIGAITGGVVGGVNNGISNRLAKNGGNLFKGSNALTSGINKLGSSTALGRVGSTLATGAARGAVSGAVGGATGAGLSSAINGVDFGQGVANALQGAAQGARQGAIAGGVMSGANMALNATPGVGNVMRQINQAGEDWKNSGDNFNQRLTNTLTSGKSPVGEWLQGNRQSRLLGSAGNVGNSVQDTGGIKYNKAMDLAKRALDEFEKAAPYDFEESMWEMADSEGIDWNTASGRRAFTEKWLNDTANDIVNGGDLRETWAQSLEGYIDVPQLENGVNPITGGTVNSGDLQKLVAEIRDFDKSDTPTTAGGWLKKAGQRIVEDANNRGVGLNLKDVSDQGNRLAMAGVDGEQNVRPETEVYRALTGETEQPFLAYGESELGNRTRRGMVADSLERLGNTFEGAQTNVTRAAAKDLGIESTGKVVENVRKKTGITNLETQAKLARELTGGENSLMDSIQRQALTASDDGKGYKVDTTPVLSEIDSIVDKYADTNMFGSQNARNKFISNLKRDISNFDSDVLSIANRMKANAADLRGKGVASPSAADSAKAKIYSEVASKLDDLSYQAIPKENVDAMFDATISEMRGRAKQAGKNGNTDIERAYNKLADGLESQPRTIKAFRSFKKDFVDVAKIADLTAQAENGAAAQMGRSFGGGLKRFFGTVAQRPVNTALAKAGGAINNVADKIAGDTPTGSGNEYTLTKSSGTTGLSDYNPATQIYNAIGRTEGLTNGEQARTANYISDAVQNANTLEDLVAPSNNTSTSAYNAVYGNPTSTNGNYWSSVVESAMRAAMAAGDATAFGQLYTMYQDALAKQKEDTTETKLTDKQRQANAAARALEDMEDAENNFGYDVSDIPLLGGIVNMTGNDYKAKAEALALQVGYMLSGATVNAQEAKNIGMAYVPQPRESETERKRKLAQLRNIISDYQKTYVE